MSTNATSLLAIPSVFWNHGDKDGGAYVSPNATDMVVNTAYGSLESIDVWDTLRTRWVNDNDYWTSCTPREMIWEGFMEPLARMNIVVDESQGRTLYRLQNAEDWDSVESILAYVYSAMCKLGLLTSLEFAPTLWPYQYDYKTRLFPTYRQAKKHFSRVRASFSATVGMLSFFTICLNRQRKHWLERVAELKLLPPLLIDELSNSIICRRVYRHDRPCQRAGMILTMDSVISSEMEGNVSAIIETFGAPIYLYYGHNKWLDQPLSNRFLPPNDVIARCRSMPQFNNVSTLVGAVSPQNVPTHPNHLTSVADNVSTSTLIAAGLIHPQARRDPITRQLPRQTWQEFMEAEEIYREAQIQRESPQERAKRLQREDLYKDKRQPSRKVQAFRWEEDEDGTLKRRMMTRAEIKEDWEFIPDDHKVFNSVRSEYDICVAFAPNAETPEIYSHLPADQLDQPTYMDLNFSVESVNHSSTYYVDLIIALH